MSSDNKVVTIIGAGLAGSEAALYLARRGIKVRLFEMKPYQHSKAHRLDSFCELVCNNLLCSDIKQTAQNMLFKEISVLGSEVARCIQRARINDCQNIAVDGRLFSEIVTTAIKQNEYITVLNVEVDEIPKDRPLIIATGPLPSKNMAASLSKKFKGCLNIHDANSVVIRAEGIDYTKVEQFTDDVIKIHLTKEEYRNLELIIRSAELAHKRIPYPQKPALLQCFPVETLAEMDNKLAETKLSPENDHAFATVVLRKDNRYRRNAYVVSNFTTDMKHRYQDQVIHSIPGLEDAQIVRYGAFHKDTYIDSPKYLNQNYEVKDDPGLYVIGQLSGIDGYLPCISSGIVAARSIIDVFNGKTTEPLPDYTMIGALGKYVSTNPTNPDGRYEPMIPAFDLLPQLDTTSEMINRSLDYLRNIT